MGLFFNSPYVLKSLVLLLFLCSYLSTQTFNFCILQIVEGTAQKTKGALMCFKVLYNNESWLGSMTSLDEKRGKDKIKENGGDQL